ncbi:hypothetical protein [Mucilaginibacter sp.]|uniref:Kelch repeat-containing protein n=1 Tax=Mucilaginibacter sp. TaxID=1882438 RepID=UPI00326317A6
MATKKAKFAHLFASNYPVPAKMKMFNRYLLPFKAVYKNCCAFLLFALVTSQGSAQGLQFNSNDSLMSKRTSYVVFADNVPTFHNHLTISFDLSLWDNDHLGYVFNITDTRNNSYSLTYIYNHNGSPALNFNIDSKSNKIEIPLNLAQLKKRKWMPVKVDIGLANNTVEFLVNGKSYRAKDFGFEDKITPKITFGKNPHYSDVPKMAIKNLVINDADDRYFFPLAEWKGSAVHNDEGDALGYVDHPAWLINESYSWMPKFSKNFFEVAGLNFDADKQQLFIFKSDSLLTYDLPKERIEIKPFQNRLPMALLLAKSVINTRLNKCYVYEVLPPDTSRSIAALDLATLTWEDIGKGFIKDQRHHHNAFFDKDQRNIYLFGGYGSFSYHKDFFKYNEDADKWENVAFKGDTIAPRFFSGSSQADEHNEVYIFGGYGNQSGNQIVGGTHYYDLYRVNLTTRTIKKCWEIKPDEEPFVSANNLILSKDKKYFYALCYPHEKPKTNLRLYKFSIKDGSYEIVSAAIPVTSERIESDFNLFYDVKQDQFICTAQEFTSPTRSTVRVFTLAAPPVSQSAYLASQQPAAAGFSRYIKYLVIVLLIAAAAVWYVLRKRRLKALESGDENDPSEDVYNTKKATEKKPNAVYILGDFAVFDKTGRDISYMFSPKIKQLFVLVLLNSRAGHGVVSKKISATLWPDKEVTKTKNIRGVTINHLRNIIADIDGIELSFVNDTYCFVLQEVFFCDYFAVADAITQLKQHHITPDELVATQLDLFSRGALLPDIQEPWLDETKVGYEESLLQIVVPEIRRIYDGGERKKALDLCRVVMAIDPFNDTALKFKLKALRRIKGVDVARRAYDEFVADYARSLGGEYPIHFDKICK